MPRKRETLDDLLRKWIDEGRLGELAEAAGIADETLRRLRKGIGTRGATRGVILALATAAGMPEKRVAEAVAATMAAAKRRAAHG